MTATAQLFDDIQPAPDQADQIDQWFDDLAASYPRKKDLSRARVVWRRMKPTRALFHQCAAAIERQQTSIEWRNGFAPYLSTWLRGKRYEDQIELAPISAQLLRDAEHIRRTSFSRCPHPDPCANFRACVETIARGMTRDR